MEAVWYQKQADSASHKSGENHRQMAKNVFSWTPVLTLKWKMLFIFCDLHHLFQTMDLHSCAPWILPKPIICELSWVTLRLFWPPFICCYFVSVCILLWDLREICIGWRRARWSFTSISGVGGWCSRRKIISLLLNKQGHSCCSPCIDCLTLVLNTIFLLDLLSAVSV